MKKRIIINVSSLNYPLSGIGVYTYELIKRFHNDPYYEVLYHRSGKVTKEFPKISKIEYLFRRYKYVYKISYFLLYFYRIFKKIIIGFDKELEFYDNENTVYFGPNYYCPFDFSGKKIVTIHDLSVFKYSDYHPSARVRIITADIFSAINNADMLITDSPYTRDEIIGFFDYKKVKKIRAIPLGAKEIFYKKYLQNHIEGVLKTYGLNYKKYLISVGTIEPRKNIERLIEAYHLLPKKTKKEYKLAIAGISGWNNSALLDSIRSMEKKNQIVFLSNLSDELLSFLYSGAKLTIVPSIYEGFGLPVVESIESGTPVICSNTSSLNDIIQDSQYKFNPLDAKEISQLINKSLTNIHFYNNLDNYCGNLKNKYSWNKTYDALKKVINNL